MERGRLGYQQDFESSDATPFFLAVEALQPGATGSQIAALLDNRISRYVAIGWRKGRRGVPKWALESLAAKLRAQAANLSAIADLAMRAPERPGKQAGRRNLAIYLANKNR